MPKGFQPRLFWRQVNKNGPTYKHLGPCWLWMGSKVHNGYGTYNDKRAHRLSFSIHKGEIPSGMRVLHECDNRPCVNPDHLKLGTDQDNMDDMIEKGRAKKARGKGSVRIHKHGKLTPDEALILKKLRKEGLTFQELGERFNINPESARLIVKGRYHSDVR